MRNINSVIYGVIGVVFVTVFGVSRPLSARPDDTTWIHQGNLLANGNFMSRDPEGRPTGWVPGRELQTATLSHTRHHGPFKDDYSLQVADSSKTLKIRVRSEKRLASPGTRYTATAWVWGERGSPASISVEFWDQNNKRLSVRCISPTRMSSWQKLSLTARAPDHCTHVTVSIHTTKPHTGVSFWDDVSLFHEIRYVPQVTTGVREVFIDDYRIE